MIFFSVYVGTLIFSIQQLWYYNWLEFFIMYSKEIKFINNLNRYILTLISILQ